MLKSVSASLSFMTRRERAWWFFLVVLRALLSLFDLLAILAIGFIVTSVAVFFTAGSDPVRVIEFLGLSIPSVTMQNLPLFTGGVLVVFLSKAVFSIILTKRAALFIAKVEARSARSIAEVCFGGDLGDARKRSREEVMYSIQSGSPAAFNGVLNSANVFVTELVLFVVICVGFLLVDPLATLGAVLYLGFVAFVIQFSLGSMLNKAGVIGAESSVKANASISDLLSVFRELLVLGKREKYIDEIYTSRLAAANSSATAYYLSGMPRYIIEASLLIGVTIFILSQAYSGDIVKSAGTIGVFLSGGFRLTAALLPLQSALLTIKSLIPTARMAQTILALSNKTGNSQSMSPVVDEVVRGADSPVGVRLESVSFVYPGSQDPALSDVSFTVTPGSQVALMGPSGAGKSTIADLLCQVLTPTSGKVLRIDEQNSLSAGTLRGRVSYVPQKPGLVSGTISDNVALAIEKEEVDRTRVMEALKLANLYSLIAGLPDGVDTPLGKLQDGLSGGQMQRLGLARALYSRPGLLVMDEATSALDAESESEIQKALDYMRGKVTVVLIAHRLNTIQHADMVVLIDEGKVIDSGTLKELIFRNPSVERVVDLMRVEKK
jgi:ATP-binding cassette subfamily C protein